MTKTNKFRVKKIKDNRITVEEARKNHSPLALFFIKNGRLIFWTALLFSITVFIIAIYFIITNIGESSIVKYESNGVIVSFDSTDNSILNGTPITEEYASKLFDNIININSSEIGVVIKLKEIKLEDKTIIYYSDNTALVKYNDGGYLKVSSVKGKYGIDENGLINSKAKTKEVSGRIENNDKLGLLITYLSDGSLEIIKGSTTFFVRNNDITNTNELFYTNLSGVSLPIKEDNGKLYYSDGTIKENNYIIVDKNKYNIKEEKIIYNNIKVLYYENGYAEIIKDDLHVMVKNSEHIVYNDNSLEIINNKINQIDIKDIMDVKEINLNNTSTETAHYIIVLEETNNYKMHNVSKILANDFIRFSIYVNGNKISNKTLNNNLKEKNMYEGLSLNNNTFLLYEGNIDKLSTASIKVGMWIDYQDITNDYMNSTFIGTIKVYIETLN